MENASKALEIAAGVLIAVMIMTLIAYFFGEIGIWPQEQEQMETAEQLSKFNLEYEVYQKKAMYGVDVISCLNKAKSNNEKYADSGSFFTGSDYEKTIGTGENAKNNYYIDVYVHINEALEETVEVYYINPYTNSIDQAFIDTGVFTPGEGRYNDALKRYIWGNPSITFADCGFTFKTKYTKLSESQLIRPITNKLDTNASGDNFLLPNGGSSMTISPISLTQNYYSLRANNSPLAELLNQTGQEENMTVVKDNKTKNNYKVWSKVVWRTALYSFKNKRFKCDYIEHSEVTGRVNKIYFSEI